MRMHHVGISVSNIENTIAFYRDNFGMEELTPIFPFDSPDHSAIMGLEGAAGKMSVIRGGDVTLELFQFDSPAPAKRDPNYPVADHGYSHFGFAIDDIDEAYERLSAAGVRFHSPVIAFPGGIRALYARDPDGYVFELIEEPKAAA